MTATTTAGDRVEVRSSRLWALFHFSLTRSFSRRAWSADHIGVSTNIVRFWLTPWQRTDEHLPLSHIAEVAHTRGFFWDAISVESSGGLNPLRVSGLPKGQAALFRRTRAGAAQRDGRRSRAVNVITRSDTKPGGDRIASSLRLHRIRRLRRRRHRAVELEPCCRRRLTFSPSLMRPESSSSASGSCTAFWITRLSGRAP